MCILTTIQKWTCAFALIEVLARDLFQCFRVFLNQLLLFFACAYHIVTWDNKETVLSTNWTRSEMPLRNSFIVSTTPLSNALQTEYMIAAIKHSELLAICKNWLKAYLAFLIILLNVSLLFSISVEIASVHTLRM